MTEEQKTRRREYMKKYMVEHKEQINANRKRWYENHKEQQLEANRKVYQRQKENGTTWQQRNKDRVNKYNREYKNKIISELRAKGIKNAWNVYLNKKEPKYENSK